MIIAGIQKTSLVDYPGKICATVFLAACNFRCGYCHNPELVDAEIMKKEVTPIRPQELLKQIEERKKYIDGVCITGGEPFMNEDLTKLCDEIKKMGLLVKVDTNGSNPFMLKQLIDFKLVDYIAMDIKGPAEKYKKIVGTNINLDAIKESIAILMEGKVAYEFRTTVVKTVVDAKDIIAIGEWIKGAKAYYLQQYSYEGKTLDPKFAEVTPYTSKDLEEMKDAVKKNFDKCEIRGI